MILRAAISILPGLDKIRIYGNVFNYSENDKMGCWIAYFYKGKVGSVFIYNNTIVNANFVPDNNGFSTFYIAGSAILEGTEQYIYNNLWFNCRKAAYTSLKTADTIISANPR